MILKPQYKKTALILDIVIRILAVSLMWWNIVFGYLINGLIDAFDGDLLARVGVSRKQYQKYDKLLDYWWYIAIFVYLITHFERNLVWWVLVIAFVVRSIGIIMYTLTHKEWLLFAYPGLFNWLFFFYVAFPQLFYITSFQPWPVIVALLLFTYWREWALHVDKIDMTHFLMPWVKPKEW